MFNSELCCGVLQKNDVTVEPNDKDVEKIYNAIIQASKLGREEDVDPQRENENKDGGIENDGEDSNAKVNAFELLHDFLEKNINNVIHAADRLRKFRRKSEDSYDTLLHTAALLSKDYRIIKLLLTVCPDLITIERTGSYKGQTALHITVGKCKMEPTQYILESIRVDDKEMIFKTKATGSKFVNNIMMGEIPLSVAVLTFNTDMVDVLLENGALIEEVNSKRDTIIHTLIKYGQIHPDKSQKIIEMVKYINTKIFDPKYIKANEKNAACSDKKDENRKKKLKKKKSIKDKIDVKVTKMWFEENEDRKTPLKLAVSNGLIDIFKAIMEMKNIFYFPSNYDGSFDSNFYDITEIDHVAQFRYTKKDEKRKLKKEKGCLSKQALRTQQYFKRPYSVIERLSSLEWQTAKPFVENEIIKMIIFKRWQNYRYIYYAFSALHIIVMLLFTTSEYYRKYVSNSEDCTSSCKHAKFYSKVVPWLLLIYSVFIISSEVYRWAVFRQIWRPDKHHNNTWYRIGLAVFALGLFIDCILYAKGIDSNDVFVVVLLTGCFLMLFLFKGYEKFSVYTVLFQKIIMGDLLRFGAIICVEFAAFCYAMYIVLRGNNEPIAEFSNFENATLTMFGYMLGLNSLDILDNVNSDMQRLVAVIYVLFILTTYILLINSLIAMMSGTCTELFGDRKLLGVLQKASVIMFLDGLIFVRYSIHDKPRIHARKKRAYMEIRKEEMGKMAVDNAMNDSKQTLKQLIPGLLKQSKKNETRSHKLKCDKATTTESMDHEKREVMEENERELEDIADVIPAHGRQAWLLDVHRQDSAA